MQPEHEAELLTEIARLYAALIRVVRDIDDPELKAELAALIWPPVAPPPKESMLLKLPTWLRAAIITAIQAALGAFLLWLIDLGADVQDWVSDSSNPVDISGSGRALLGLLIGLCTGVVTGVYRAIRPVENDYPEPPKP